MFRKKDILNATGAKLIGADSDAEFKSISQNSKTIKKNELFIAIKGERFDGHRFIPEVFDRGVEAVIVKQGTADTRKYPDKIFFEVEDTIRALADLAQHYRQKFPIPVIGITGSNGKTTTKDLLYAVLETKFHVLKTLGNQNNFIGLPFSIFRLTDKHQVVVLEMGMSVPGEIRTLADIAKPSMALITNIGDTHLEGLKSKKQIAKEKRPLFDVLSKDGVAFINIDDPYLKLLLGELECKKRTFSMSDKTADYFGEVVKDNGLKGQALKFHLSSQKVLSFDLPLAGKYNAMNALAAVAIADDHGVPLNNMKRALETFEGTPGRSRVITLKNNMCVIDDSYNANPTSMVNALGLLRLTPNSETYAILGDMRELGLEEVQYHQELGELVADARIDNLLTCGPLSKYIEEKARHKNKALKTFWTLDQKELINQLKQELKSKSDVVILVKGSHGMRMDRVVEALVNHFGKR